MHEQPFQKKIRSQNYFKQTFQERCTSDKKIESTYGNLSSLEKKQWEKL